MSGSLPDRRRRRLGVQQVGFARVSFWHVFSIRVFIFTNSQTRPSHILSTSQYFFQGGVSHNGGGAGGRGTRAVQARFQSKAHQGQIKADQKQATHVSGGASALAQSTGKCCGAALFTVF